ncbi:MAG TPA: 3-hydroxyacyl-CoA dehydrogenase NAD-binding domain-containing protein [Candidatus Binatia bacterium]
MSEAIENVGVVGLGVMGFDIACLYAMKGCRTFVYDAAPAAMDSLSRRRDQTIERLEKRQRISASENENLRYLLIPVAELAAMSRCQLITEAVSENANTKLAVYRTLRETGFTGLLTTNTSSVTRSTLLRDGVVDSRRFALTHFFNPVLYTRMVEIVQGDIEPATGERLSNFLKALGRDPVATQDISGFVSNGILMIYAVMALRLLECGARIEQVDRAAKELKLLPPFISFDSWKPSIVEDVTRVMRELRGDEFLRSSQLLTRLAESNPRFYVDQKPNAKIYELAGAQESTIDDTSIKRALRTAMIVAAARVAELGESPAVVDRVATEGIKMPQAPLKEIDEQGAAVVLDELAQTNRLLGNEPLAAPELLTAMAQQNEPFYKDQRANPWLRARQTDR